MGYNTTNTVQSAGLQSLTPAELKTLQTLYNSRRSSTTVTDPALDLVWAKTNKRTAASSYFDYYFSGQDVKVYVDGAEGEPDADLTIMDFAFNVQQQKQPLFGFWDYVYRIMLRGTRIISGQFRIATTVNDAMDKALTASAIMRQATSSSGQSAPLSRDDQLIEQYWHQNIEMSSGVRGHNKFSSHPPFDFMLIYGLQSVSIGENSALHNKSLLDKFRNDNLPLYTDTNERLVAADTAAMRFKIEGVELTNVQVEFSPDGTVCSEVYSFLARDMYIPS
jgi:hypothetical protein